MAEATVHDARARDAKTRVFLAPGISDAAEATVGGRIELPVEDAHHIFKVLRAGEGDPIEVVTSAHRLMLAEVYGDARHAEAHLLQEISVSGGRTTRVDLYQAVPKGKHMELVVEKATELGVDRIVPLLTDHGEVRPAGEKADRWRRIAEAAARQSLQLRIPEVSDPKSLREVLGDLYEAGEPGVMLHNEADLPALEESVSDGGVFALLVGPEGGWSEPELALANELGFGTAQMGPYRLRCETAGVVAVARAEACLRDLQNRRNQSEAE